MASSTVDAGNRPLLSTLLAFSLFLAIAGGRLLLLQKFSTDIPQFDAWGIEGETYRSYFSGTLRLIDFFAPCNEHRIAFTRFLYLGLLLVNNLWDNQMQTVVNALFFSATAAILFRVTVRQIALTATAFWWLLLLAIFALPYGWENARWGFQSQFYLLVAFSLAILYTATIREYLTGTKIALTGILQLAALFTMKSGVLASLAVFATAVVILFRCWPELQQRKSLYRQMTVAILVIILWKFAVSIPSPPDSELNAPSLTAFFAVLVKCLSWPLSGSSWWWLFSWLPWLIICISYLLKRNEDTAFQRFTIGMGIWTILSAAATAYARNSRALHSKYADPLAFSLVTNGMALILLCRFKGRVNRMFLLLAAVWTCGNGYTLYLNSKSVLNQILPEKQLIYNIQKYRTQSYLATGNVTMLVPVEKHGIPDRDTYFFAKRLNDPIIKPLLPRSINLSYQMTGQPSAPLSRVTDVLLAAAVPLLVTGSLMAAACLLFICYDFNHMRKDFYEEKNHS